MPYIVRRISGRLLPLLVSALLAGPALLSCNEDTSNIDDNTGMELITTAVQGFSLKAQSSVMSGLDSVFFSIDLVNGVIFNADSLPVGTKISKLIPVISLPSTVSAATITMEGGENRTGETDYLKNPSDTIDFSGKVTLSVTASNGFHKRNYTLKVNVHKIHPDSLIWTNVDAYPAADMIGPGKPGKLVAGSDDRSYILSKAGQGDAQAFTLYRTDDISAGGWQGHDITSSMPQEAKDALDFDSFTCVGDRFYALAKTSAKAPGILYSFSMTGDDWQTEAQDWVSVLGAYDEKLLGIRKDSASGEYFHTTLPATVESVMSPDFPYLGSSNLCVYSNDWSDDSTAFLVGGESMNGLTNNVWGFDGQRWTSIGNTLPPVTRQALVVPYLTYRQTGSSWVRQEIKTWILLGGRTVEADDNGRYVNGEVWISYDAGVNWHQASDQMQLPDTVQPLYGAGYVVHYRPYSGNLSNAWASLRALKVPLGFRLNYEIDGYQIDWECPYVFIAGGYDGWSAINSKMYSLVLAQLTFMPII